MSPTTAMQTEPEVQLPGFPEASQIGRSTEKEFLDLEEPKPIHPAVKQLAQRVADMEPSDPSILRATPAYNVLAFCGTALRWTNRDLYHQSEPVRLIHTFWSHSWHGSKVLKALLLLLLHNGPAATIAATLAALIPMALHIAGLLPGIERETRSVLDGGVPLVFGAWSIGAAGVVFTLVFFGWRSNCMVFLDQICIHQFDAKLKFEGIVSIGAILKYSEHFLLVWDATYAGRLWCILELAAFLRSHEDAEKRIYIRPTAMAPCVLGVGLGLWISMLHFILFFNVQPVVDMVILVGIRWGSLWLAAAYLRAHYRNTEKMLEQLSNFTVESARSACCMTGHTRPDGSQMICDRDVICQCIDTWYGSVEKFEAMVRTRIRIILHRQLGGLLFPYGWQVVMSAPLLWGFADITAARGRRGDWSTAGIMLWCGLTWCLFLFPCVFQLALLLAKYFRTQESQEWLDQLKTMAVALLLTALSYFANWSGGLVSNFAGACAWVAASMLISGAVWLILHYHSQQVERELNDMKRMAEQRYAAVLSAPVHHHG